MDETSYYACLARLCVAICCAKSQVFVPGVMKWSTTHIARQATGPSTCDAANQPPEEAFFSLTVLNYSLDNKLLDIDVTGVFL
jgi:hypothetical protein